MVAQSLKVTGLVPMELFVLAPSRMVCVCGGLPASFGCLLEDFSCMYIIVSMITEVLAYWQSATVDVNIGFVPRDNVGKIEISINVKI